MSGTLRITNDYCDPQSVILTLESSQPATQGTSRSRMGSSLKIDIGREATIKLPDFLMEEGELYATSDTEPHDQTLERQGAKIKTLEAEKHNALVPADETDSARIEELTNALHNQQEVICALNEVKQLVENEFSKLINGAEEDQLQEIQQRHGVQAGEDHGQKVYALETAFANATVSEQVNFYKSAKNAVNEDLKRKAAATFNDAQKVENLDKDAKYSGDLHRGPDSTTDLRGTASTHAEQYQGEDSDKDDQQEEQSEGQQVQSEASDQGDDKNINQDQSTSPSTGPETGDSSQKDSEDREESHSDIQEKADEAVEKADEAQEAATLSAESAQETADAATEDSEEESDEEVEEESNNPQDDEKRGYPGRYQGGGSTEKSRLEDRPVKMSDPDEFDNQVDKLKVAQLSNIESKFDDLKGEGKKEERQNAVKELFHNSDEETQQQIVDAVNDQLEA